MPRPLTLPERAALARTMAAVIPRLPRHPAPRRARLRRRHAVAMAVATVWFIGAMWLAWGLNRAM